MSTIIHELNLFTRLNTLLYIELNKNREYNITHTTTYTKSLTFITGGAKIHQYARKQNFHIFHQRPHPQHDEPEPQQRELQLHTHDPAPCPRSAPSTPSP